MQLKKAIFDVLVLLLTLEQIKKKVQNSPGALLNKF